MDLCLLIRLLGGGDWCAEYDILIREKQRGIDGMVRGMEFSGDGKKRSVSLDVNFNLNFNLNLNLNLNLR